MSIDTTGASGNDSSSNVPVVFNVGRPRRTPRRRIPLYVLQDVYDRVACVQKLTGLDSMQAVYREAFRLFEWYAKRRVEGWSLQLVDQNGRVREIEFL